MESRPSFGPNRSAEVPVFVVLTGVLGGLLLVFTVLCVCRCCRKSSKSFKRQQVVFTKYSSEKRSSCGGGGGGKGSRNSRSYEPSVVVDLEAAYSDSSTSPREVEGLSQGTTSRNSPPDTSESHKFFAEKDIGRREAASDDQHNGQCVVFERTSMALPSTSSSSPKTVVSMTIDYGQKRFSRSPPICRQSSVCDDSSDHGTPPKTVYLERDRRQSAPATTEAGPPIVIPQVIVALHDEVEKDGGKTCAEVYTYPCAKGEAKREKCFRATVPRRTERSMDLEEFEAKVKLLRAAAAQLAPEIAKHGAAALSRTIAELSPVVGAVMGVECLLRAPSTEVGKLEERMELRCRQNSNLMRGPRLVHLSDDDEEPKAKVRYNDTGSLEEVNEQVLDSFVDDVEDLEELRTEYVRAQYRKLWALRATYEEDVQQGEEEAETEVVPALVEQEVTSAEPSHTTSFESNTEPVDGDHEAEGYRTGCPRGTGTPGAVEGPKPSANQTPVSSPTGCCPDLSIDRTSAAEKCSTEGNCLSPATAACSLSAKLLLPNPESRRQSYKSMLNRRLRRPTTTTSTTTGSGGGGSAENSFDSLETEDGSSTEGSRLEAVTTSVESTTDNTDSAGESQVNRLQQMKADSGYKSLETNGALQQMAASTSPDRFSEKRPLVGGETLTRVTGDGVSETVRCEEETEEVEAEGERDEDEEDYDEGVGGMTFKGSGPEARKGPRVETIVVTLRSEEAASSSASRKRRDYVRERQVADTRLESVEEVGGNGHQCTIGRLFRAPRERQYEAAFCPSARALLSRDYSIDEKSDALFREFSRLDPALEAVLETGGPTSSCTRASAPRLSSRRHHRLYHHAAPPLPPSSCAAAQKQHHQHHHHYSCYHKQQPHDEVPMALRSKLSPQLGIEEEMTMTVLPSSSSRSGAAVTIPIIEVAADEDAV